MGFLGFLGFGSLKVLFLLVPGIGVVQCSRRQNEVFFWCLARSDFAEGFGWGLQNVCEPKCVGRVLGEKLGSLNPKPQTLDPITSRKP